MVGNTTEMELILADYEGAEYIHMSLIELKLIAKNRQIKGWYVKSKQELIDRLTMKEMPLRLHLEKITFHELRIEAKRRRMRVKDRMTRDQLFELLYPNSDDVIVKIV